MIPPFCHLSKSMKNHTVLPVYDNHAFKIKITPLFCISKGVSEIVENSFQTAHKTAPRPAFFSYGLARQKTSCVFTGLK